MSSTLRNASSVLRAIDSMNIENDTSPILPIHQSNIPRQDVPIFPTWINERPYLTKEYLKSNEFKFNQKTDFPSLPLKVQELIIIDELLNIMMVSMWFLCAYVFQGFEGKYIQLQFDRKSNSWRHNLDPKLTKIDPSLVDLVERIMPMCIKYIRISDYVEQHIKYNYGVVNHAFCEALRLQLKEYLFLVARLETQFKKGNLNIQKMWLYIQPIMRVMDILDRVTSAVQSAKCMGGALLNVIYDQSVIIGGDEQTRELFQFILERTSAPFCRMLELWIYEGVIDDPYHEFMVQENPNVTKEGLVEEFNDNYWEQRYTLRHNQLPRFFEKVADKILMSGKYLNVIRECGKTVKCPFAEKIYYTSRHSEYVEKINRAYEFSSKRLLDLILVEKKLMDRLRSIKHFFLLDQGNFFINFIDAAESELLKNANEITLTKLQSLLETSLPQNDPYKNDVTCDLLAYNLKNYLIQISKVANSKESIQNLTLANAPTRDENLTGFEAFTLDYKIRWPISLIVNKKALTKYQILFRHLFYCKYVERMLCTTWVKQKFAKELSLGSTFSKVYTLRHKMQHFLSSFHYFMTFEVIEQNWCKMQEKITSVKTLDDVMKLHNDFLDSCLKSTLLSVNIKLFQVLSNILHTCVVFSKYCDQFISNLSVQTEPLQDDEDYFSQRRRRIQQFSEIVSKQASDARFIHALNEMDKSFSTSLRQLMKYLSLKSVNITSSLMEQFKYIEERNFI